MTDSAPKTIPLAVVSGDAPATLQPGVKQLGGDKEWFARFNSGGVKEKQEWAQLQSIIANSALR